MAAVIAANLNKKYTAQKLAQSNSVTQAYVPPAQDMSLGGQSSTIMTGPQGENRTALRTSRVLLGAGSRRYRGEDEDQLMTSSLLLGG